MRCRDVRRAIVREEVASYGGSGDPGVRRHLFRCRPCREEADRLALEIRLLRAAWERMPLRADFTRAVLAPIMLL